MTDQQSSPPKETVGQVLQEQGSTQKQRFRFDHPVLPPEMKFPEKNSSNVQLSQSRSEGIPTLSQILNYPKRDKKCRLGKTDPSQPPIRAVEVLPGVGELPFTTSRIRVGVGGKYMVLHLINDENPVIIQNIKDGEWFEVRACRILETDCQNVVIFD
jgi:hypothetical protein